MPKPLQIFKLAYNTVPAYKEFLAKNHIDGSRVRNMADFQRLPIMSKENYLRAYKYEQLFPNGRIEKATTIAATSGSGGDPFYLPRGEKQDEQYEKIARGFLEKQFDISKKRTLVVIGFGFGIWIGGIFTYKNLNRIAAKGCPLTIAPVGTNIEIFLDVIKKLGDKFDQIVLAGYPPFIKDVLDEAEDYGIYWKNYHIKILTAAEEFSEKYRDYVAKKAGIKNIYTDIINIYGTVELGTMAHETALTTLIRRLAVKDNKIFRTIFPNATRLPTLAQYYPENIYFEQVGDEVIASGYGSAIPLVRYRFPDIGGVVAYDDMVRKLKDTGISIDTEIKRAGIQNTILRLPFVYVYGRSDFAIILRGANIFPDEIRLALHNEVIEHQVTGKFVMQKKESSSMDEYLEITVELRKNVKSGDDLRRIIGDCICDQLLKHNSEFTYLYGLNKQSVIPHILLRPYHDSEYLNPGAKQKWTIHNKKK